MKSHHRYHTMNYKWIFQFYKFPRHRKKNLICTSDLRVSLVFISACRTRFLKYMCLCWPTYRHYDDRCNCLVNVLVCWRSQILFCVKLLMVEQWGILICGRSVCTEGAFDQVSNSKIRLPCDNVKFWTFHFLNFFCNFLKICGSLFLSFVMFHFEPLIGHRKHNICRANVKELGTFNSWITCVRWFWD
jgi:hypothetical protein